MFHNLWKQEGARLPEVEVGRQGEAQEVGKVAPGTHNRAWASQSLREGKRTSCWGGIRLAHLGSWDHPAGLTGIPNEVAPSRASPQPGNRQEKQRARPTDCHWQNELSPPIFQRHGGMNCSLEPCGPLLIEFRCLRTPSNKASSFQTDVPPLINLGASKINRFGADLLPPPAWIPHPERSPNKSLRVLLA